MNKVLFPLTSTKAPAVPKGTDWRDYRGPVESEMFGIMVPMGVIVFDLDTYKGVTTEQIDTALGCALNWDEAELQETKNGGVHYAFSVPEDVDLINGQDVLGIKNFDTRSSFKGYIATGKGYKNLTFLMDVPDALHDTASWPALPDNALRLLQSSARVSDFDDDDDGLLEAVSYEPIGLSMDDMRDYLNHVPDSSIEEGSSWLKIAMGIYHETKGSEEGWELFDEVSKRAPDKYDRHNNRKRWDSIGGSKRQNPVTFASVIEMAGGKKAISVAKSERMIGRIESINEREQLEPIIKEVSKTPFGSIEEAMVLKLLAKKFKEIIGQPFTVAQIKQLIRKSRSKVESDFYTDYVFVTSSGEYMDKVTKIKIGPRSFDVKHDRETPPDGEGNPQRATTFVQNKIECVYRGMYAPMFDDFFIYDGVEYFNTYKPNPLARKDHRKGKIVDMVKRHIAHLLPDEREQRIVIDFLAHNVQFPGRKLQWAIVLQGVQGDGKSFLAEMMKFVLGQSNCRSISAESLDEKYTPWAENNVMVFIEELKLDNYRKYETMNKLKPFITNPTVSIRRMREDIYEAINTSNYFALTNFKDALPIDVNDRRYCVLFSQWQSKEKLEAWMAENPDYYPDLYETMRAHPGEILDWLLEHQISDEFLAAKRAPQTRAKEEMVDMSKSEDWMMVEDAIEQFKCHDINSEVVNITRLVKKVRDEDTELDYTNFPKTTKLKNIMTDMGYHFIGRYKDSNRKNQTLYAKDDTANPNDFQIPF